MFQSSSPQESILPFELLILYLCELSADVIPNTNQYLVFGFRVIAPSDDVKLAVELFANPVTSVKLRRRVPGLLLLSAWMRTHGPTVASC